MGGRRRREEDGTDVLYSVEREMRRGKRERKRRKEEFARQLSLSLPLLSFLFLHDRIFFPWGCCEAGDEAGAGAAHSCGMVGGAM